MMGRAFEVPISKLFAEGYDAVAGHMRTREGSSLRSAIDNATPYPNLPASTIGSAETPPKRKRGADERILIVCSAASSCRFRGTKLGGYRWNIQTVASKGNIESIKVRSAKASKRAADLLPTIADLKAKGDAVAYGRLGMLHLFGRGGTANVGKARDYLSLGASGGDSWSMVELGMLYKRDHNKSDRALAFAQFAQAAEQGNRVGAYRLACAHHFGIGTAKDPVTTLKSLKQSASKGYPVAQAALGSLYEKGDMVEKDLHLAYAFYTLASRQGDQRATSHLRFLARNMTVQEIQYANALADGYRAKNPQLKDL